jgi:hypothetical protein|tara:strand:+ start:231 stop:680 length:450 start_codon:yes stop_codon:yes gene_type:complete
MNSDDKYKINLIGKNQDDLRIISAYLQDSIVTVKDIVFLKQNRTFVMIVNRFMWEDAEKIDSRKNKRIRCAVKFEEVIKVESININQKNKNKPMECLAIECSASNDQTYKTMIFFAGNGIIALISETIEIVLQDLGKSWSTKHIPRHKI